MNFDNLQDGQYVDITYRAGKTKKLITVKNLCFSCYFKKSHYISFSQDVKKSSRNSLGYRGVSFDTRTIVSMVERKQPLQVGDVVKYRLKMYGETHIGVVVKLDYCYEHPMDFKKDSRVCEDVQVITLEDDQPKRVFVYSWLTEKGDYLDEAEEILQKELENLKEQLNKIQEKKKLCKSIAKAGK